jgi:hypothetical protein
LVSTITDAVHDLGAEVRTEVRGALRAAGCGAADLPRTIEIVHETLSTLEREAARNRRNASAKIASAPPGGGNGGGGGGGRRDPRKTRVGTGNSPPAKKPAWADRPKPWNERDWKESDVPCPHKDCKGSHWKIHCPLHPPEEAGTGQAKVARGETTLTINNELCDDATFDDSALTFHELLGISFPDDAPRIVELQPNDDGPTARALVSHVPTVTNETLPAAVAPPAAGAVVVQGMFVDGAVDGAEHASLASNDEPPLALPPDYREMQLYLLLAGPLPGMYVASRTGPNLMTRYLTDPATNAIYSGLPGVPLQMKVSSAEAAVTKLRVFNLLDGIVFPFFHRGPWPTFTSDGTRLMPGEQLPGLTPEEALILLPQYGTPHDLPLANTVASPPVIATAAELLTMLHAAGAPTAAEMNNAPPPPVVIEPIAVSSPDFCSHAPCSL